MMKFLKLFLFIFMFLFWKFQYSQVFKETYNVKWGVKQDSNVPERPMNVAKHAYLYVAGEENFPVYYWIEYSSLIDSLNGIHKMILYESDGVRYDELFFFTLKGEERFAVNLDNYKVESANSSIIGLISDNDTCVLARFNYYKDEKYGEFQKLTKMRFNKLSPKTCPLSPYGSTYVKVLTSDSLLYRVTFQLVRSTNNYIYKLKAVNDCTEDLKNFSFQFSYMNVDNNNIYFVNKKYYLERVCWIPEPLHDSLPIKIPKEEWEMN